MRQKPTPSTIPQAASDIVNTEPRIEALGLALNRMLDRLDNAYSHASRFSADAAHELRTPLTIIRGELELVASGERLPPDIDNAIKYTASLKATRDQAQATPQGSGQTITAAILARFARTARERMRIDGGGYRRDHLRVLAQRVEVADTEVRIMGSKSNLLQTLVAAGGGKTAMVGVRSSVLNWRMG